MSEEITEKAQEMGWVPKEEWKGDPEKWRPAEEFVSRGENIVPILKDRLDKTEKELKMALKLNTEEIKKIRQQGYEQAKAEYEKKIEALKEKKFEAVQSGDVEAYKKVDKAIETLKPPEPPEKPAQTNPVFEEWHKSNTWYQSDMEMSVFADSIGEFTKKVKPHLTQEEFYKEVEAEVKRKFSNKFENQHRNDPGQTESGGRTPTKGKKQTFADLPDEAKATYNRLAKKFEAQGRKLNKDDYAKEYFLEG